MIYKNNQSGRSMIEMLGVLAIVGVLSVGGIAGYSKAMSKYKTTQTLEQIGYLTADIKAFFVNQQDYTGFNTQMAINFGLFPNNAVVNNKVTHPYGGTITTGTANSEKNYTITYNGANKDLCVAIVSQDWANNDSSALLSLQIAEHAGDSGGEGQNPISGETVFENTDFPITPAEVAETCVHELSSISWTYN